MKQMKSKASILLLLVAMLATAPVNGEMTRPDTVTVDEPETQIETEKWLRAIWTPPEEEWRPGGLPEAPGGLLGPGGYSQNNCHVTNAVCAMAMAHASYERINNKPNAYSHLSQGHGSSMNPVYGVETTITTSLDEDTYKCDAPPNQGCGASWSDIADACKAPVRTTSLAVSGPFSASVAVTAPYCADNGQLFI